jgi:predicted PurR-regulated permease PerM
MKYLGNNFLNSFGKVIQAQIVIALINSILSVIVLSFLGFPKLLALGAMVFVLGLVPVAGVIISLIPLSLVAFNIGGFIKVFYVLIMVLLLHGLESYLLNPKFMSVKTKLPVFLIFLVLIVSEHLMGIWGLLIGIPLFMFILDMLSLNPTEDPVKTGGE